MFKHENYRGVSVEFQMSENNDKILIVLSGVRTGSSEDELFPLRTRLANLGIDNRLEGHNSDILVLSIPIWIISC
jgi:hypothetical protein